MQKDGPPVLLFCRKPCLHMQKKLETCQNLNLTNVGRPFSGYGINVTIIN